MMYFVVFAMCMNSVLCDVINIISHVFDILYHACSILFSPLFAMCCANLLCISINQSINALYSGIFHPYTNYVITQLCDKKNKQTSMHVHIAYASNAGAMGKCIYDHCQQCSVGLNCMTSL